MREGNAFLASHPYHSGCPHANDMVVMTPIFADGALIAFAASIGHTARHRGRRGGLPQRHRARTSSARACRYRGALHARLPPRAGHRNVRPRQQPRAGDDDRRPHREGRRLPHHRRGAPPRPRPHLWRSRAPAGSSTRQASAPRTASASSSPRGPTASARSRPRSTTPAPASRYASTSPPSRRDSVSYSTFTGTGDQATAPHQPPSAVRRRPRAQHGHTPHRPTHPPQPRHGAGRRVPLPPRQPARPRMPRPRRLLTRRPSPSPRASSARSWPRPPAGPP